MSFWQPRSVLQLVLVGFFAALAPLCAAILFTVQTLEELAASDRQVTRQVIEVTRLGQEIQGEIPEMERHARQYLALSDPELAALFQAERSTLLQKLDDLQQRMAQQSPDVIALLHAIEELDPVLLKHLNPDAAPDSTSGPVERLNQEFALITEHRRAVQQWLQASVDRLLEKNAAQAEIIVDALVLQLSFLVFATLALLVFFSYRINKPVQDLTKEIDRLGTSGLSRTIEISGPQEMEELGQKLEWLRKNLHENEQQKEQFLRHISHELKTPLASLREGADLLAEQVTGRLSQQQLEVVEIVRNNAIELQRLIENLIDYNQLPRQELLFEEFDLEPLWQELLDNYRISIDQKALHLVTNGSVDAWVADRYKLKTTLDNLLSNAINYTPEGGIIDIAWRAEAANLVVEVANSGAPIPIKDAERVFEPFFQSKAKRTGPIKGSGIGLSVARECIEVQGGSLALAPHNILPICFRLTCPAH
jgi:two-component system, NtrC family, sensor histidine kinase GlrK